MRKKPKKRLVIHSNAHRDRRPTAPTVPTRLVSKEQYLKTLGEKGVTYAVGAFFGLLGIPLLLFSLGLFYIYFMSGMSSEIIYFFYLGVIALALSLGAFCGCKSFFTSAQEIEPVAPITRHNTGDLPAEETLVRASAAPPSHQQDELLRAALQSSAPPPEELLRATVKSVHGEDG